MINNYFNLPFGAQLLLWTSRMAFYGSCRTSPNKYELINLAYEKVGIDNGCNLLKKFLLPLKGNPAFEIQPTSTTTINDNEINLVNCLQEHKNKYV